jgi:hypothetical protein
MTATLQPTRPKNLSEAREVIRSLEKGQGLPPGPAPATLDKARTRIEELTGQPFPRPTSGGGAFQRAKQFLAENGATSQTGDPQDLTRAELVAALDRERDPQRISVLFGQLQLRERGVPIRSASQAVAGMSEQELLTAIEAERNSERLAILFGELTRRSKN